MKRTGEPSNEFHSIPLSVFKTITPAFFTSADLVCGIANPSIKPVVLSFSRS